MQVLIFHSPKLTIQNTQSEWVSHLGLQHSPCSALPSGHRVAGCAPGPRAGRALLWAISQPLQITLLARLQPLQPRQPLLHNQELLCSNFRALGFGNSASAGCDPLSRGSTAQLCLSQDSSIHIVQRGTLQNTPLSELVTRWETD